MQMPTAFARSSTPAYFEFLHPKRTFLQGLFHFQLLWDHYIAP